MLTNRIIGYQNATTAAAAHAIVPAGFAAGQVPQLSQSHLAVQVVAMQQAYEQALVAAGEGARKITRLQMQTSLN